MIAFLNDARTDPPGFARRYLNPQENHYPAAVECYREMLMLKPRPALLPSIALTRSARAYALDTGRTGKTGHTGTDGSTVADRISRYGRWTGKVAENLAYGMDDPLDIVLSLLIDAGVPGRGHRRTILDPALRYVGVAIERHRTLRMICVQDFASGIVERGGR